MSFFWKDFNKTAKDACKVGKPSEYKTKFANTAGNGITYEAEVVKTTSGDKAGHASSMTWKLPKNKGFSCDEVNIKGGDSSYAATSKWSAGNIIPDAKIKAKISHGWNAKPTVLTGGYFDIVPKKANLAVEYAKGPLKAGVGLTSKIMGAQNVEFNADAVFNAGDLNVGACVTGQRGAENKLDYNVGAHYRMGDLTTVFQTAKSISVFNLSVHKPLSSDLQIASNSSYGGGKLTQNFGGKYKIDSVRTMSFGLDCGDIMAFQGLGQLALVSSITTVQDYGKMEASLSYKQGSSPQCGISFTTPK